MKLSGFEIENTKCEKFIGRKAVCEVKFKNNVTPFMKTMLMNFLVSSVIAHLMFHSCTINNKISHIYESCLRVKYNQNILSFKELLERDRSFPIHNRNLHILATEMFKVVTI